MITFLFSMYGFIENFKGFLNSLYATQIRTHHSNTVTSVWNHVSLLSIRVTINPTTTDSNPVQAILASQVVYSISLSASGLLGFKKNWYLSLNDIYIYNSTWNFKSTWSDLLDIKIN
jgi:hypothetical protein